MYYTQRYPLLSYENLRENPSRSLRVGNNEYKSSIINNPQFYTVANYKLYTQNHLFEEENNAQHCYDTISISKLFAIFGLKFHISLQEDEYEKNRANGWNIAKDILIQHNVGWFKVAKSGIKLSARYAPIHLEKDENGNLVPKDYSEVGKDITIYTLFNPEKTWRDWKSILAEITSELEKYNVIPGTSPVSKGPRADCPYNKFIFYRFEKPFSKGYQRTPWHYLAFIPEQSLSKEEWIEFYSLISNCNFDCYKEDKYQRRPLWYAMRVFKHKTAEELLHHYLVQQLCPRRKLSIRI